MKWLLIVLMPLALAGCVTREEAALPMALGPSDTAQTSCLRYGDSPAFDCKSPSAPTVSIATE